MQLAGLVDKADYNGYIGVVLGSTARGYAVWCVNFELKLDAKPMNRTSLPISGVLARL